LVARRALAARLGAQGPTDDPLLVRLDQLGPVGSSRNGSATASADNKVPA